MSSLLPGIILFFGYFRFLDFSAGALDGAGTPYSSCAILFIPYIMPSEKRKQVDAATRWTEAEAMTAVTAQSRTSIH